MWSLSAFPPRFAHGLCFQSPLAALSKSHLTFRFSGVPQSVSVSGLTSALSHLSIGLGRLSSPSVFLAQWADESSRHHPDLSVRGTVAGLGSMAGFSLVTSMEEHVSAASPGTVAIKGSVGPLLVVGRVVFRCILPLPHL